MLRWAAVLANAGVLALAAPACAAPFKVGAAVVKINPAYPVYMGGYGGGPSGGTLERHVNPLTATPEDFTVRAIAISAGGGRTLEIATVDTQGYFAGYQEGPYGITDARDAAAAFLRARGDPGASPADVIVSSLHSHAGPTVIGIWGPPAHQQRYLEQLHAAVVTALERAYLVARPATLTWGAADVPWVADLWLAEGNAFEGWPRDGSLAALWARDAASGRTIATFVTQPGYANIVFGPGDLVGPNGRTGAVLSTDFPDYLDAYLERRLGGTAIVTIGTLGNQTGPMQGDTAPSPDLPKVHGLAQTRAFDDIVHQADLLGNETLGALGRGRRVTPALARSADQYLVSPATNPLLAALDEVAPFDNGQLWHSTGFDQQVSATDRAYTPPYGQGAAFGTWVTSFRIGDLLFLTLPGEFFPSVHATWNGAIHGAGGVFVIGAAQDFLGYDYPAYAYPFTFEGSDEAVFNPSLTLGDQVVAAGEQEAAALGFRADQTSSTELTALQNNYGRAVTPGVQLMPFPPSGDIDLRSGGFAPVLEGFSQAARASSSQGVCAPTSLLLPCPGPPSAMGAFRWSFGDGRSATTPPAAYGRAWFSPFIRHAYCRPGVYQVRVEASQGNGAAQSMTLPVTVYPALRVAEVRRSGRARAHVSGGSGRVLVYRWSLPGGRTAFGSSVAAPRRGKVTLTVVDSTGTIASSVPLHEPSEPGPAASPPCPVRQVASQRRHRARRHGRGRRRARGRRDDDRDTP